MKYVFGDNGGIIMQIVHLHFRNAAGNTKIISLEYF